MNEHDGVTRQSGDNVQALVARYLQSILRAQTVGNATQNVLQNALHFMYIMGVGINDFHYYTQPFGGTWPKNEIGLMQLTTNIQALNLNLRPV